MMVLKDDRGPFSTQNIRKLYGHHQVPWYGGMTNAAINNVDYFRESSRKLFRRFNNVRLLADIPAKHAYESKVPNKSLLPRTEQTKGWTSAYHKYDTNKIIGVGLRQIHAQRETAQSSNWGIPRSKSSKISRRQPKEEEFIANFDKKIQKSEADQTAVKFTAVESPKEGVHARVNSGLRRQWLNRVDGGYLNALSGYKDTCKEVNSVMTLETREYCTSDMASDVKGSKVVDTNTKWLTFTGGPLVNEKVFGVVENFTGQKDEFGLVTDYYAIEAKTGCIIAKQLYPDQAVQIGINGHPSPSRPMSRKAYSGDELADSTASGEALDEMPQRPVTHAYKDDPIVPLCHEDVQEMPGVKVIEMKTLHPPLETDPDKIISPRELIFEPVEEKVRARQKRLDQYGALSPRRKHVTNDLSYTLNYEDIVGHINFRRMKRAVDDIPIHATVEAENVLKLVPPSNTNTNAYPSPRQGAEGQTSPDEGRKSVAAVHCSSSKERPRRTVLASPIILRTSQWNADGDNVQPLIVETISNKNHKAADKPPRNRPAFTDSLKITNTSHSLAVALSPHPSFREAEPQYIQIASGFKSKTASTSTTATLGAETTLRRDLVLDHDYQKRQIAAGTHPSFQYPDSARNFPRQPSPTPRIFTPSCRTSRITPPPPNTPKESDKRALVVKSAKTSWNSSNIEREKSRMTQEQQSHTLQPTTYQEEVKETPKAVVSDVMSRANEFAVNIPTTGIYDTSSEAD